MILLMQITCTQKETKDFEIKNLGDYHDLYVQSDILLPADVFNNVQNICLKSCLQMALSGLKIHLNLVKIL